MPVAMLAVSTLFYSGTAEAEEFPICSEIENGMQINSPRMLASNANPEFSSGIVVEDFSDAHDEIVDGVVQRHPAPPIEEFYGYLGARVTHCESGKFFVISEKSDIGAANALEIFYALEGMEKIRTSLKSSRHIGFYRLEAEIGQVVGRGNYRVYQNSQETCACYIFARELRPRTLEPYLGE